VRGGLAVGLVAVGGCDSPDAPQDARAPASMAGAGGSQDGTAMAGAPSAPVSDFGHAASPPIVIQPDPPPPSALTAQVVSAAARPSRVLYSWTTDEQYSELRDSPVLLTRSERPGLGGGVLRQVLGELAAAGDPLSVALAAPEFEKTRYAWPNPWATLLGWPGESYGNKLIQIELREEAWVMVLVGTEWQVVDLEGAAVPRADAIETPERIGAVFHVHEADGLECGGSFVSGGSGAFREYALLNESMIARWSLATAEMRDRLEADIAMLDAYRAYLAAGAAPASFGPFESEVACAWRDDAEGMAPNLRTQYALTLAIASAPYEPIVARLDALIAALEDASFEPDPVVRSQP